MKQGILKLNLAVIAMAIVMAFAFVTNASTGTFSATSSSSFTIDSSGVITAYTGSTDVEVIVIPATINGVTVKGIGASAFADLTSLTTIAIPNTVTSFGDYAFQNCSALYTMVSYDSLTDGAIEITYVEDYTINIPENLSSMGFGVFASCTSISKFSVADTNTSFKTGTLADTATTMYTDDDSKTNRTVGEMLLSYDGTKLYRFAPGFHYTGSGLYPLPEGIVSIEGYALEKVGLNGGFTIPTTVTTIGSYAFYSCGNLNSIEFAETSSVAIIGDWAFAYNSNLNITLPASVTAIGEYCFAYCQNIQIDISKTQLTEIPKYAFYECNNLHTLTFPTTLKVIGDYAFLGCDNLNEVIFLGDTLEAIGTGAFQSCQNLHSIEIPEGVTTIEADTFDGCQNLNTIILPDSLTTIESGAFADCQNIHTMVIPANVTYIAADSFSGANTSNIDTSNNEYAQSMMGTLPAANEVITVSGLKFTVTKSSETGGTVAISGGESKKITTVNIPATIKYHGYTFKVTTISANAFKGYKKLKKVTGGANLTSIGKSAFANCKKLKSVSISSKKLAKIGASAFSGCKKLSTVTLKTTKLKAKKVGKNAFKGIKKNCTFKVPKKKMKAYKKIFIAKGAKKSIKVKKA